MNQASDGTNIENAPKEVQPMLKEIRRAIREEAPDASEGISYWDALLQLQRGRRI